MTSIAALFRFTAFLALTWTSAAVSQHSSSARCDAGKFAELLSSRQLGGEDLWRLCRSRYSEGACLSAKRSLVASDRQSTGSFQQWAKTACDAVEAATARQRQLLLRQRRTEPSRDEDSRLASIRSSAAVHRLSLDVARHYRYREQENPAAGISGSAPASGSASASGSAPERPSVNGGANASFDNALEHKSLPIPHGRFDWEGDFEVNSSAPLEQAVKAWVQKHRKQVNLSSAAVQHRANAFQNYTSVMTTSAAPTLGNASNATNATKLTANAFQKAEVIVPNGAPPTSETLVSHTVQKESLAAQHRANVFRKFATVGTASAVPTAGAVASDAVKAAALHEVVSPVLPASPVLVTAAGAPTPHITATKLESGRDTKSVAAVLPQPQPPHSQLAAAAKYTGMSTGELDTLVDEVMGAQLPDGSTVHVQLSK